MHPTHDSGVRQNQQISPRWLAQNNLGRLKQKTSVVEDGMGETDPCRPAHTARATPPSKTAGTPKANKLTPATTARSDSSRSALKVDEAWSVVGQKTNPVWLWVALERETRKIVAPGGGGSREENRQALVGHLTVDASAGTRRGDDQPPRERQGQPEA
jgi:hypothetical protein